MPNSSRTWLQRNLLKFREPIKVGFTIFITCISFFLALGLRFDFNLDAITVSTAVPESLLLLLLFRFGSYAYFNLHSGYWRYVSTREARTILFAHTISTILYTASALILRVSLPRSVIIIEYTLSILLAGGSRLLVRIFCEEFLSDYQDPTQSDQRDVIVLGGGSSGHMFVKTLLSHRRLGYRPVLVLDDDDRVQGLVVHGLKVEGKLSDLPKMLRSHPAVSSVVVAIPTLSRTRLAEIEATCKALGIQLKRLQSFENIALQDVLSLDGPSSVESILDKETNVQHDDEVRRQIKGKRVLVTGAGGSIGSELARQIMQFEPARIILFDSSEYNLFRADLEFSPQHKNVQKRFVIGSIGDKARLEQIFEQEKPQMVFHAAAYKHVPMMEYNASQAFINNVLGTWNVLEASSKHSVERFVLISTDKAIEPSSVMGCSKRLAELIVQQFSNGLGRATNAEGKSLNTSVVRFGNVINSTGSVIPLFREQILSGGPVTVTHPDIERFFMSSQEAVRLVLTAGTLGKHGEVYVLDMGQKIKIVEVARKMLTLYGRTDIPIVFTGLRPGEKITEKLVGDYEALGPTEFQKVSRLNIPAIDIDMPRAIRLIEEKLPTLHDAEVGQMMHRLVSEIREGQKIARERGDAQAVG